ncbi:MAG TPA: glycoside hydrolase family 15 protein [Cellulomonas sp.]
MSPNVDTGCEALRRASIDLITGLQAPSGAFPACPTFAVYRYSWLRDGTYIAVALDTVGRSAEASAFHDWVGRVIDRMSPAIDAVVAMRAAGRIPEQGDLLPTRYTLEGAVEEPSDDEWPTVQLDGYGVWIWGLREHLGGALCPQHLRAAVRAVADYLVATWDLACYDCWEEFGDRRHTSTLGAIAAGLAAAGDLVDEEAYRQASATVVSWVRDHCVVDGSLVKGPQDDRVDGSLLTLAVPLRVFDPDEPLMKTTVRRIQDEIVSPGGGVWRYRGDTYFGGGAWLLLTCWLGLYEAELGRLDDARRRLAWAVSHADAELRLPEQVVSDAQVPSMVQPWVTKWGTPASPLLWSHAMYLLLDDAIRRNS